jgi:hypothetical protein
MFTIDRMENNEIKIIEINTYLIYYIIDNFFLILKNNVKQVFGSNL